MGCETHPKFTAEGVVNKELRYQEEKKIIMIIIMYNIYPFGALVSCCNL